MGCELEKSNVSDAVREVEDGKVVPESKVNEEVK